MAVSHIATLADGNAARNTSQVIDMDGNASFLTGTVLGITVATSSAGTPVDASAALAFTSSGAVTQREVVEGLVRVLEANLTAAKASFTQNAEDQWVINITAIQPLADAVDISLPIFTPGV